MSPRVLVAVQARMGSTRLPGKVLLDIGGRPVLELMVRRLGPVVEAGATLAIATSDLERDRPVVALAEELGTPVVAGDERDVLHRFVQCLDRHPADLVVRLTADCPLIDPAIVERTIDAAVRTGADYASNTLVRTYPDGLDVEVLRADALRRAADEASDPPEREHVTPYLLRHPRRFTLTQVTSGTDAGDERWTLDEAADLDVIRDAVHRLPDPDRGSWTDIMDLVGRRATRDAPVRAVPGPPVPHEAGTPYERRWDLLADERPLGRATVTVDDGVGRLDLDLPAGTDPSRTEAARDAVRTWLAADLQTTTLIEDEGAPHGPRT